jgi:hypothetical protein
VAKFVRDDENNQFAPTSAVALAWYFYTHLTLNDVRPMLDGAQGGDSIEYTGYGPT